MSTKRVLLISMVASVVLLAVGFGPRVIGNARASVTEQRLETGYAAIPYFGRLSDAAGQPVAEGTYVFLFTLYAAEIGGEPLWSEVQEGIMVKDGAFTTSMGGVNPIPASFLDGRDLWLSTSVRGPEEVEFTALTPRQQLSAISPTAPSSPSAGPACAHDHVGEVWSANVGWSNAALRINNSANGPSIWGNSTGGGNGVRGESSTGLGVYGWSNSSSGVVGRSEAKNGVEGYSSAPDVWAGVYGEGWHYGVFGRATASGWYGVFSDGNLGTTSNLWVGGNSTVVGSKSAAVHTDDGSRLLYSEESTQVWFSDYGFSALQNGTAVILIDPLFAQTVNLQEPYHVFLQAYGDAELYVADRTATQFQVHLREGDPNVEFSYRIVAKRLGYEEQRLEPAPVVNHDGNK